MDKIIFVLDKGYLTTLKVDNEDILETKKKIDNSLKDENCNWIDIVYKDDMITINKSKLLMIKYEKNILFGKKK